MTKIDIAKNSIALIAPVLFWLCFIFIVLSVIYGFLWVTALLTIFLLCLNSYFECYAYKGLFKHSNEKNYQTISILSFNVNLAYKEFSTEVKATNITEYLIQKNADVVLLQEYNPHLFPVLQKKLSEIYRYGNINQYADRYKSVFSKYPICEYVQIKDDSEPPGGIVGAEDRDYLPICGMLMKVCNDEFYIVNCHLHSNNYSPALRKFLCHELTVIDFIKAIFASLLQGINKRVYQVRALRNYLKSIDDKPVVICGDMNDVSGSSVLKIIRGKNLKDAWWMKGFGMGYTLDTMGMKWRLDHILYSDSLVIDAIEVDKVNFSDHRPVLCKFHLL